MFITKCPIFVAYDIWQQNWFRHIYRIAKSPSNKKFCHQKVRLIYKEKNFSDEIFSSAMYFILFFFYLIIFGNEIFHSQNLFSFFLILPYQATNSFAIFGDKLFLHQILFTFIDQFSSYETFRRLLFGICTRFVWVRFVLLKLSTEWVNFLFDCCTFTMGL